MKKLAFAAFLLPLPFLLAMRIGNEEDVPMGQFPEYAAYRRKTPYRLIPFVW